MSVDPNIKVLVVDDSKVMRKIIRVHLKSMGIADISEAENGMKALEFLEKDSVDLVLCDWCMDVMHGIDVLKHIRAHEATKDIPFIMVTAEAQPHLVFEAVKAKVSDYVTKPFTRDDLQESIEKVFHLQKITA